MKRFIKKHNLGMLTGLIIFLVLLFICVFQFMLFRSNTKKIETALNGYLNEMDKKTINIPSVNNSSQTNDLINVIDKYWTDDYEFDDDVSFNQYDDMTSTIKENISDGLATDISYCNTSISNIEFTKVNSKSIDVVLSLYIDSSASGDFDYNKSTITGIGLVNAGDSTYYTKTIRFVKKGNNWKIGTIYDAGFLD